MIVWANKIREKKNLVLWQWGRLNIYLLKERWFLTSLCDYDARFTKNIKIWQKLHFETLTPCRCTFIKIDDFWLAWVSTHVEDKFDWEMSKNLHLETLRTFRCTFIKKEMIFDSLSQSNLTKSSFLKKFRNTYKTIFD